jgi:hypothetical protein
MTDTLQQRAPRFLRWLHDDQAGYIEIVAGATDPERPAKIALLMDTRAWFYLDPERPDLYAAAGDYAAQLAAAYGNVYTGIRTYRTKKRAEENVKPGRVIFIDDAPAAPERPYSASIRTSEASRHAYYKCTQNVTKDDARRAAAALGGDPSGVDLTQLVRFPGTFNTKHNGRWSVELEPSAGTIYQIEALRSAWPALATRLGTTGAAWGEAYRPAEWENLPDGGPLLYSPYDTRDDSDSAQIAALAYNLLSADVCKPQARAIADYLYSHLRPGKTREHYRAHFDAELERYTPKHYRPKEIRYTGAAHQIEPLPPAEHKPEPKSRARKDRPQQVAGAAGYLAWLRTQVDAQSGSVMLSQKQCAVRLGCCVRTIKRYEKALGTQIERRVFAQRQAGCLFILSPDVVTTLPKDVVIADAEIAQQSAENVQPAIIQVEHTAAPVTSPPAAPPAPLRIGIRRAIRAIEQDSLDQETGAIQRLGRATPDRVRAWLSTQYPDMDTTDIEAEYPEVRKALQAKRTQERNRAFWDTERAKAHALDNAPLLAALIGCASRMQAAERKHAGSPWSKRCAAIFAIYDDERRRRGLSVTEAAPAPARDLTSRKAARARVAKVADVLNQPEHRPEHIDPAQLGFANVVEDTVWLQPSETDRTKPVNVARWSQPTEGNSARVCSSQSCGPQAGPTPAQRMADRCRRLEAQQVQP